MENHRKYWWNIITWKKRGHKARCLLFPFVQNRHMCTETQRARHKRCKTKVLMAVMCGSWGYGHFFRYLSSSSLSVLIFLQWTYASFFVFSTEPGMGLDPSRNSTNAKFRAWGWWGGGPALSFQVLPITPLSNCPNAPEVKVLRKKVPHSEGLGTLDNFRKSGFFSTFTLTWLHLFPPTHHLREGECGSGKGRHQGWGGDVELLSSQDRKRCRKNTVSEPSLF